MHPRLILGVVAALAACSVKPVTFTPDDQGPPGADDAGVIDGVIDAVIDGDATRDGPMFTVSVELVGNGAGVVTSSPGGIACPGACTISVPGNTTIRLSAAPSASSTFTGWGGACTGTDVCSFTVTADTAVTAGIAANNDLIVMRAGTGTGTVTSNPAGISCGADCAHAYPPGTTVTLSAVASADSSFAGWSGGGCTGTGTCVVTPDNAVTVTAQFELRSFVLSVNVAGPGIGVVQSNPTGISCGGDCSESYLAHTVVTLTPSAGLASWSGACTGSGACQVTMLGAASVTATFAPAGRLFAINEADQTHPLLQRVDPVTQVVTDVGPLGVPYAFGDCAWSFADSTLYVADGRKAKALYRLNLATGAATLIGVHGLVDLFALAYHPPSNQLYGVASGALYKIDAATGAPTEIGPTGTGTVIEGLAWDSRRNRMIALAAGSVVAYTVDLATGAMTQVQTAGGLNDHGMAYDPVGDRFLVADLNGRFIQLDPTSFTRTDLPNLAGAHSCLAFVP